MKKVDLNGFFSSEPGKVTAEKLFVRLAYVLRQTRGTIKARKAIGWANALSRDGTLLLDESDHEDLTVFITDNPNFSPVYEVQLLDALAASTEVEVKE